MTGIAGLMSLSDAPADPSAVKAMLKAMPHRGTRSSAWSVSPQVALGICHTEETPTPNDPPTILLDGCLSASLDTQPPLVDALHETGTKIGTQLDGEFAFAYWDPPCQSLVVGRDLFGTRPLYVYRDARWIAFASEIKAFWALDWVSKSINRDRIADYVLSSLEGYDKTTTFFRGIEKIAAGTYRVYAQSGRVATHPIWHPPEPADLPDTDEDWIDGFRHHFQAAIRSRYQSDDRTGLLLSGGLDSIAIGSMLREEPGRDIATFSLKSGWPDCEESHFIDIAQKHLNAGSTDLTPSEATKHFPPVETILARVDSPFVATLLAGPLLLYSLAQKQGRTRMLDGVDGDLVTSLSGNYAWHLANVSGTRAGLRVLLDESRYYSDWLGAPATLLRFVIRRWIHSLIPRTHFCRLALRQRQQRQMYARYISRSLLRPSFSIESAVTQRMRHQLENEHPTYPLTPTDAARHTLTAPYVTAAVERYEEGAALFGIQATHPFLDRRLVEYCLHAPWDLKIRRGEPKYLLRAALKDRIPEVIRQQHKIENIGGPFVTALYQRYLNEHPTPPRALIEAVEPFLQVQTLAERWRAASSHTKGASMDGRLWNAITLGEWLRHHL